jgi:hypothetical protein
MLKKRNIVLLLIILYMLAGCYPGLEKPKAPLSLKDEQTALRWLESENQYNMSKKLP